MAETPEYRPDIPDEDLDAIEQHYVATPGEFLVAVADGSIVGMGAYTTPAEWKRQYLDIDDVTAELTRMRVAPAWQGQGVGSSIYRELRDRAHAAGFRRFVLDTGVANETARGFYEGFGFTCRREIAIEYRDETLELALYTHSVGDDLER
jgi:ribosomal protein S18 acetylase RimI-like enzyme